MIASPVSFCQRRRNTSHSASSRLVKTGPVSIAIESGPVFTSREEAEWEVFRRRWQKLTGEAINLPYRE